MFQALEEVAKAMDPLMVEDECCQAVGYRGGRLTEIQGVALKVQSFEGGKSALKERAIRREGHEEGVIFSSPHTHYFESGSQPVEKREDVPKLTRRQVHVNRPHSVEMIGDKGNCLNEAIVIDGDVDGVGLGPLQLDRCAGFVSTIDGGPKGGGPSEDIVPVPTDGDESENRVLVSDQVRDDCNEQFWRETIDGPGVHRWWS